MGIFNSYDDVDLEEFAKQESDKGYAKPINPIDVKEVDAFDRSLSALPRGVAAGALKAGSMVAKPIQRIADTIEYTLNDDYDKPLDVRKEQLPQFVDRQSAERTKTTLGVVEEIEDKKNTGAVGQFLMGIGDFATRAVIGGVAGGVGGAVAVTGLSEADYTYNSLVQAGVDPSTAFKVASTQGVVAGGSVAIPVWRGAGIAKNVGLIAAPVVVSQAGRELSQNVLEKAGFEKQAKQYEFDKTGFATELALSIIFNRGTAYLNNRVAKNELSQEQADIISQDAAEAADDASAQLVGQLGKEMDDIVTPNGDDIVKSEYHKQNVNTAINQVVRGQPISVPHNIQIDAPTRQITIPRSDFKSIRYDDPRLDAVLNNKAKQMGMEWATPLLLAIRRAGEKSHNNQVSPKGAQSIMQIMPDTKAGLERNYKKTWDIDNPEHATEMALYLVREMSEQYKTKDPLVLAAHYNGGFANGKAMQKNGKPKALETVNYVNRIRDFLQSGQDKKYTGENTATVFGADGSNYEVAYEVKSLNDLIASNDQLYGVNPNYPAELQPRDRTREASRQQIERIADDLKPELLGENPMISQGAPIIGLDNVVESGNGRTLAIGKAYADGKADAYRQFVSDFAGARGWDISGINNPVLVRTRLSDVDRVEFAKLANESDVAQFSASERAKSDVDRLPDASLLKLNSDGNINLDGSMDYVRAFIDQVSPAERATMITADGRLSQGGKQRIEQALVQHAYGDSNLVARLSENLGDDSKTVLNALLRSAPQLAQLADLVKQGGRHSNTIAQDLAQAAQKLSDLKANDLKVDDYLNQEQLFGDDLSPGAKDFLKVFDQNSRSSKAINDYIKSKIDEVDAKGDPRQGSLFGNTPQEQAALSLINEYPDHVVSITRQREDGSFYEDEIRLSDVPDYIKEQNKISDQELTATQTAVTCALKFGG
ncbi:transglycosylase SLT domain-containing protein [Acinetobacter corruptisaponis]|uniref:Transglycosylase SLT domain-containing protein n=1 Tax=Acinetobacter corruptisaponis TaxID=3045147 RepID=A0ABY8SAY9_9GAMM|nr:transglycosylase SLT domain-containing protein [Acinetobacter sp. KCTC 92772]WHP06849.1 transglycosylase SLT domain-containing protein [Acinetobacter sp. KCTC 92772]